MFLHKTLRRLQEGTNWLKLGQVEGTGTQYVHMLQPVLSAFGSLISSIDLIKINQARQSYLQT